MGVDTPETKHPTIAVEYFRREASAFTKAHLEGKTVALVRDRTGDTADRYGRWLRYVYLDGDAFNARLIREGYAHADQRASFSKTTGVYRPGRTSEAARNRLMEPPLKFMGMTTDLLRELKTKHIDLLGNRVTGVAQGVGLCAKVGAVKRRTS